MATLSVSGLSINSHEDQTGEEENDLVRSSQLHELKGLLMGMMSDEEDERTDADEKYEEFDKNSKLDLLFQLYKDVSFSHELRSLALDCLYELYISDLEEIFLAWGSDKRDRYFATVIESLRNETDKIFSDKIAKFLGEQLKHASEWRGMWSELYNHVHECAISNDSLLNEKALMIIRYVGIDHDCDSSSVWSLIEHQLTVPDSPHRNAAIGALRKFIKSKEHPAIESVPRFMSNIMKIAREDCVLKSVMECNGQASHFLFDLSLGRSEAVKRNLEDIISFYVQAAHDPKKCFSCQCAAKLGLPMLCNTFASSIPVEMIDGILSVYLIDVVEGTKEEDEWVKDSNALECHIKELGGEGHIKELVSYFGYQKILPRFIAVTNGYIQDVDWKRRVSALSVLEHVVDWAEYEWNEVAESLVDMAFRALSDTNPRVRFGGCCLLHKIVICVTPFLEEFHQLNEKILRLLISHLDDHPRVADRIVPIFMKAARNCHENVLIKYYDDVMPRLLSIIRPPTDEMQRITAFNVIAYIKRANEPKFDNDFIQIFTSYVDGNRRFFMTDVASLDPCFSCYENKPDVIIRKTCDGFRSFPGDSCGSCACRPTWCVSCLARIFLSAPSFQTRKVPCPLCRAMFCPEDVLFVRDENDR